MGAGVERGEGTRGEDGGFYFKVLIYWEVSRVSIRGWERGKRNG